MTMNAAVHSDRQIHRWVDILSYGYIGLPIVIFILGWVRWYISIPATLLIGLCFFFSVRKADTSLPSVAQGDRKKIIFAILIILGWVFSSGIGGFVFQNSDHWCRNEIYRALVEESWPVQHIVPTETGNSMRFLSYYIGFWMPAALFGKVFGLGAGYVFQYLWASLGVFLVFVKTAEYLKRWSLISLFVFIFFSGLDIIGNAIVGQDIFHMQWQLHIEWWSGYQFSSHTTQLYWVFNQAIYGWLITLMLINNKRKSNLVLIWACGLLSCTFPFAGMLPFLIYKAFAGYTRKTPVIRHLKQSFIELLSFENIIGGGLIGIISAAYLLGNSSAGNSAVEPFHPSLGYYKWILIFFFLEAGIYHILVFRSQKRNPLFYLSFLMLLICPFIKVGSSEDFCMRASIPALLILCLLVIDSFSDYRKTGKAWFCALLAAFLIGCFTPVHEMARAFGQTLILYKTGQPTISYTGSDLLLPGNFSSDTEGNLFYNYLAK